MVIESSSVIAMMQQEDGFEDLFLKMAAAKSRSISAANYLEAGMVLDVKFQEVVHSIEN